jgi:hypothetical protein
VGTRAFEVVTTLSVEPEEVIDFLMDLNRHLGLHPFLTAATVVDTGTSPEGPWWDWSVEERPKVGPFRYRLRFPTRMTRTSAASMTAVVRAAPGCRLRSTTRADAVDGGCRLVEQTEVTAPWPVLGYMARQGEAAHVRTSSLLPGALG